MALNGGQSPETVQTKLTPQTELFLVCIAFLAHHYKEPLVLDKLRNRLLLSAEKETPESILKLLGEHGFNARLFQSDLTRFTTELYPVIAFLKNGESIVLFNQVDEQFTVYSPEKKKLETITKSALTEAQTGKFVLIRPKPKLDLRSKILDFPKTYAWFWEALSQNGKSYALVSLAAVMINVFALASPLFVMIVYDRVVPNAAIETLWVLAIGVFFIAIFDFLIRNLRAYFIDHAGKRADFLLSSKIFEQTLNLQMSHKPKSSGVLVNSLREFESIRDFFASASLTTCVDVPFIFLFVFVIWLVGGPLAWVTLLAVPMVVFFGVAIQIPLVHLMRAAFQENAQKNAHLFEVLSNIETIKSTSAEGWALQNWETYVGQNALTGVKTRALSTLIINFAQFVLTLSTIAIIVAGVYQIKAGEMTLGTLIACMILNSRALAPLAQVAQLFVRYQQAVTSLRSLHSIMSMPVEKPRDKKFLRRDTLVGEIELRELNFSYPQEPLPALRHISIHIKPGERVGIIGRVGSGKSTLLKLIANLYAPQQGACLVDGIDLRQIDPTDLRKNLGYLLQDSVLFYGTVRENIALGQEVEDKQILRASTIAGLENFLMEHPAGYDQPVGERGELISGGQRQAIAIARSLLRDPPILLFDEPTAHMDHSTEKQFIVNLQTILPGKTLVLVTHRTTLLNLIDRIIVLDKGQVVMDGAKNSVLNALTEKQSG